MTQHFTEKDFRNLTQVQIQGERFGDRLTNSINFVTDFIGFGIKQGVGSVQQIVDFVSPTPQSKQFVSSDPAVRISPRAPHPADDPVFIADNPQHIIPRPGDIGIDTDIPFEEMPDGN